MNVKIGRYFKGSNNRRININIDDYDTFSLDHTLALIILPALIQLKNTKHGVPNDFAIVGGESYDDQQSFDFYTETSAELFEVAAAKWDEVLDKMIWSFQQIVEDRLDDFYQHGEQDFEFVETEIKYPNPVTGALEPTYQMTNKNKNSWYDHEGAMLHEARIQEGLELFGKYYRNLWD